MLLEFGAAAFRTLDPSLVMFGDGEGHREFLFATLAEVFVIRHGHLQKIALPMILVA